MKNKFLLSFLVIIILTIPNISLANDNFEVSKVPPISNKPPMINAKHSIVLDRLSNQILYGKNEKEKCKMASTTKIMTSIIVIENCNLQEIVNVSNTAAGIGGSRLGLSTNDKISVKDLLYGLMLKSGNDGTIF